MLAGFQERLRHVVAPQFNPDRREFLKRLISDSETQQHSIFRDENTFLEPPLRIGKLNLHPLNIEHDDEAWEQHGEWLQSVVRAFDIIIPEYYPPEYQHLADHDSLIYRFAMQRYVADNRLFMKLAEKLIEQNKELWVVDPAYDEAMIKLRAAITVSVGVANAPLAYKAANSAFTKRKLPEGEIEDISKTAVTRRELLRLLGWAGIFILVHEIAGSLEGFVDSKKLGPTTSLSNGIERDFRRVLIAEAITQIAENLPELQDMLIIYPRAHLERIKFYLENEKIRQEHLQIYSSLSSVSHFESLFYYRHYPDSRIDDGEKIPLRLPT